MPAAGGTVYPIDARADTTAQRTTPVTGDTRAVRARGPCSEAWSFPSYSLRPW